MDYVINADKAECCGPANAELKEEGKLARDTQHRQVKYLTIIVDPDHGKLKRVIRPTLGFKTTKTAYATVEGFQVILPLKNGQVRPWHYQEGITEEVRLIERVFGLAAI